MSDDYRLPEDVRLFIYKVTLHLQLSRSKTPEQNDAMFYEAYRLYAKYDVEGLRRAEEAGRKPDLTATGSPSGSVASKEAGHWGADGRCVHCGAGNDAHHSFTCPTNMHPDKRETPSGGKEAGR